MRKNLLLLFLLCSALNAAAQLPYTDSFASADDFAANWQVVNPEGDYCKWEFYEWSTHTEDGTGCASCTSWNGPNNDWLVMAKPLQLTAGKHHLTFYARETPDNNPELLEVLYATTADTVAMKAGASTMTVIGDYAISNSDWRLKVINFDVPADGAYYFAFHSKTESAYMVTIDELTIDEGDYQTSPEVSIVKALLPYSNCDLSDQSPIGVRLTNTGTGATTSFTLSYSVNGGTAVSQTFTEALGPDETRDYYFDQTADLADLGDYNITIGLACNAQTSTTEASVSHYAPITTLPIETNFYLDEGVDDVWTMLSDNSWTFSTWSSYYECQKTGLDGALLSHCITFEHPFRVKISYTGGSYYGPAGFYVAYGRPNTDISTWTKVFEDDNVTDEATAEFDVTPDDPGEYSLAIVDNSASDFKMTCIYQVVISEILSHDVRVEQATSPFAASTPVDHLKAEQTYTAVVSNRGSESVSNLTVSLKQGDTTLSTSAPTASLAKADSATVSLKATLQGVKAGDEVGLTLVAATAETDEYDADNTLALPTVLATDTIFATDQMDEFVYGTGAYSEPIAMGNVYTLAVPDTLTSISVGLTDEYWGTADDEMGLAVYSLKADGKTIDRQYLSMSFARGSKGGLYTYSFAPRVLPAGKYYFEVQQLTETMIGLAYEESTDGLCYQNVDGQLVSAEGAFLAIRANFAHGSKPYKKNVAVKAITKPADDSALFTSAETIEAVLENLGSVEAKDVVVRCQVGNNDVSTTTSLQPYETKTVALSGIDLATPGQYELTVTATAGGDEDLSDNTLSRQITSEVEQSPYVLDFEHCKDFATDHEFNPRWWTENRNTANPTDGFWRFDYPHNSEVAAGFMAFNVKATTPDMTTLDESEQTPGFFAHDGERFGAAFCVAPDWNYDIDYSLQSDTWLVSPCLTLSTNSSMELYVKTHALESQDVVLEKYRILVSTTDDSFSSFSVVGGDREAPLDWTKVSIDLSDYDNKSVYVAVQYFSTVFQGVVMMVDDIRVVSDNVATGVETLPEADVQASVVDGTLSVTASQPIESVQVVDANGRTIHAITELNTAHYSHSLGHVAKGVYLVRVKTSHDSTVRKVVVK